MEYHIPRSPPFQLIVGLPGDIRNMGAYQNPLIGKDGLIRLRWFMGDHVKHGPPDKLLRHRPAQGLLVDHFSPGSVNKPSAPLHLFEIFIVNKIHRLRDQDGVDADVVGSGKPFVPGGFPYPQGRHGFGVHWGS